MPHHWRPLRFCIPTFENTYLYFYLYSLDIRKSLTETMLCFFFQLTWTTFNNECVMGITCNDIITHNLRAPNEVYFTKEIVKLFSANTASDRRQEVSYDKVILDIERWHRQGTGRRFHYWIGLKVKSSVFNGNRSYRTVPGRASFDIWKAPGAF